MLKILIKKYNDKCDSRPVVNLDICFDGRPFNTEFTLKDRREYIYSILLEEPLINPKCFLVFRYSCHRGIFLGNTACLAKENNDEDKDT